MKDKVCSVWIKPFMAHKAVSDLVSKVDATSVDVENR